jgi:dienelactone hydrolase
MAHIKVPLLVYEVETYERGNAIRPALDASRKEQTVPHQAHFFCRTQHGFHRSTALRYKEDAAKLAWERNGMRFRKHLV